MMERMIPSSILHFPYSFAMKRLLIFVLAVLSFASMTFSASAQSPITVTRAEFINSFPAAMRFTLEASSSAEIQSVALTVRFTGLAASSRFAPKFDAGKTVKTEFNWDLQSTIGGYVPPGVRGEFWWHLEDAAGNRLDSPRQSFRLDDVAHTWKKLENDQVAVFWYIGSDDFGKRLFDRAKSALEFLQRDLDVNVTRQLQILVYGNRNDFFNSSAPGQAEWTGGRTYSDYGVILIHVDTSNLDWGLGATSHELTHAIIHEKIASALGELSMPHWMDEGLAVYNETNDHSPDPQFEGPLRRAIANNTLMTLRAISGNFPADSSQANLAYGESYSAVSFMFKKFGKEKVAKLLQEFKQGARYDDSFKKVFGVTMDEFDNLWRKEIGAPERPLSAEPTRTPGAVPTFGFSTAETATPGPKTTPTQVAVISTPASRTEPTPAPAQPSRGAPGLCGGLLPIGGLVIAAWWWKKRK